MRALAIRNRWSAVVGALLILAAAIWHFALAERWTQRLPPGWTSRTVYAGYSGHPERGKAGIIPKPDDGTYERVARLIDESRRPHDVVLEEAYTLRDIVTRKITWEYITRYAVDPATGEHTAPEYRGQYAVMPRKLGRGTYRLRSSYLEDLPVTFAGVENIQGLDTYRFEYAGPIEYTAAYQGTAEYEGVKVEPGQEIRCVDDQFYFRVWAEPLTGMAVKLEEGCPSGDYIIDVASGRRVAPVLRWAGITVGDDLAHRVAEAVQQRLVHQAASIWIPAGLFLIGVLVLAASSKVPERI